MFKTFKTHCQQTKKNWIEIRKNTGIKLQDYSVLMDLKKIREKELVIRATLPSEKLLVKCLDKVGVLFFLLELKCRV